MSDVALNRKGRRAAAKAAAAGAASVTAAALLAGVSAPTALAPRLVSDANIKLAADPIAVNVDLITTGGILGLVTALGYDSIPIALPGGAGTITINLHQVGNSPEKVYNAINAVAIPSTDALGLQCSGSDAPAHCRIAPVVTIGGGMTGLGSAMNSLWSIALGTNLQRYAPLPTGSQTNTIGIVLNDPLRPNGGIKARFGQSFPNVGTGATVPDAGPSDPLVNNHILDLGWEYQPQGDFPVNLNPFSLINSLMAVLPPITDLLTTAPLDIVDKQLAVTSDVGGKTLAPGDSQVLGELFGGAAEWIGGGSPTTYQSLFGTLVAGSANMPIFEPLNLGIYGVNSLLNKFHSKWLIGNPINNILGPVMKILANIGYADVLTPTDLQNDPSLVTAGYTAYDRTFAQQQIKFGRVAPLTSAERRAVPGDVLKAFADGLKAQAALPLFGLVVKNPASSAAATKAVAAVKAPKAAAAVAAGDNNSGSDSSTGSKTRRGSNSAHSGASTRP